MDSGRGWGCHLKKEQGLRVSSTEHILNQQTEQMCDIFLVMSASAPHDVGAEEAFPWQAGQGNIH